MKRLFVKALSLCLSAALLTVTTACGDGAAGGTAASAADGSAGDGTDLKVGGGGHQTGGRRIWL